MEANLSCPRCRRRLTQAADASAGWTCTSCSGLFLPATLVQEELLQGAVVGETDRRTPDATEPARCPGCGEAMSVVRLGETEIDRCPACSGVWLDVGEQLQTAGAPLALSRYLLYSVSLPERAVRSTIGLAAGAAKEAATFLVPQAFQSSTTYEIVVRNSLRFLTEDVGGVRSETHAEDSQDDFLARKAVGNFVDLAGLTTLHVSPLWLLAIVSDVAYGTKGYLVELAEELKREGLIDETSTIHHADDVLSALGRASGSAASLFDTPPLSVDELRKSLDETRAAAMSADLRTILPEAELKQYWNEMRDISRRENVSLLGVSGAMTMHSLGKLKTVSHGALTGVQVAGGLVNRHVIGHYVDALEQIRSRGFYQIVRESYAPYVEAVWANFSVDRETWTEKLVSGRAFGQAFEALGGWFRNRKADASPEAGDAASNQAR